MDATSLYLSLIFSSIGVGFFIFGKKQKRLLPLLIGMTLIVYPYFVSSLFALVSVGVVLLIIPIIARKFF